jgi:serine/threonine protein phosphatase PrpC/tetratricopeptide (TPR) repeat protein
MAEDYSGQLTLSYYGQSDIGMIRSENQDSFGKLPENDLELNSDKGQLFIVADGVGGHTGGKTASSMAVNIIGDFYFTSDLTDKNQLLKRAVEEANFKVYQKASTSEEFTRMATTCSTLLLREKKGAIAHVGDSRIYKIENNRIEQLTNDHTQVEEMLREGLLTKEEAENYPSKSVLVRAVGVEEKVKVDLIENIPLRSGQCFVLCSDGLGKVTENEILKIITENSCEMSCKRLIDLANERGGKDNVTVLVVKINSTSIAEPKEYNSNESIDKHTNQNGPDKQHPYLSVSSNKNLNKKNLVLVTTIFFILLIIAGTLFFFRKSIPFLNPGKITLRDTSAYKATESVEINDTISSRDLILKAQRFFDEGKIENALKIYKKILDKEPMYLEALNGIKKIADYYFQKAEKLRNENNFKEALYFYNKVKELQPDNKKVDEFIIISNNQIQDDQVDLNKISGTKLIDRANSDNQKQITVTNIAAGNWDFTNSDPDRFVIEENGLEFNMGHKESKPVYYAILSDVNISTNITIYQSNENSRIGIIAGYENSSQADENYFLFSLQNEKEYSLQKISGNNIKQLLFLYSNNSKNNPDEYQLQMKCSGNIIRIYSNGQLLSSYENPTIITGKAGLFIDKNISAKFYNLSLQGNKISN